MSVATPYRADIDGLRAIAVLSVVGFHLGFRPVAGGFAGVDVFFVISGYLIGRTVWTDVQTGQFSLVDFYAKRMRRLFPALFAMLLATSVISMVVLYPAYLVDFGKSLASAALSISNFYFWSNTNYFDAPVETKPLLHTWSLAVEEQFYLFFPPIVMFLFRAGTPLKFARFLFVALFGLSFAWGAYETLNNPVNAFYLPQFRAWELLLGVLLAIGVKLRLPGIISRSVVALAGLACAVMPTFLYGPETPFPGFAALLPCLGAALLIVAGEGGRHVLSPVLCWRPVAFVGLISYSLYLWHWPIITLYQQYTGDFEFVWTNKLIVGAICFAVAVASWWAIERPFRRRKTSRQSAIFRFAAVSVSSCVACAVAIVSLAGFPSRFSPEVVRVASYLERTGTADVADDRCFLRASEHEPFAAFDVKRCLAMGGKKPNVLLIGDSHAQHLLHGLRMLWPDVNLLQAMASRCAPLLSINSNAAPGCEDLMDFVFGNVVADRRLNLIIIAARWQEGDLERMDKTFEALSQLPTHVLIVGPTAQYKLSVPQLIVASIKENQPDLPDASLQPNLRKLDDEMRAVAARHHLEYLSALTVFCHGSDCVQMNAARTPYQFDYGHLTAAGSEYLVTTLFSDKQTW